MKLVDDARSWWKWHSTYVFAVLAVLPEVWISSPELQSMLPLWLVAKIAPFIGGLGFLLRIRAQGQKLPPQPRPTAPKDQRLPPA
jgi:hypothetical protein